MRRTPDPCVFVIFGASGDLTQRKLFPALYSLAYRRLLPEQFAVVGVARTEESDDAFRERMEAAVREHGGIRSGTTSGKGSPRACATSRPTSTTTRARTKLARCLAGLDEERGTAGNRLYYFAVPPSAIGTIVAELGQRRTTPTGWIRLVIEKPFGHDLESAQALTELLRQHFAEEQIFRIDHYLGKETVQNMLALRFANGIFEPIWNRQFIDHVQITVAETIGIEGRAGYYEKSGAIRDIFQNHLLQLLALTAMEPPIDFTSEQVRDEKVKVLHSIHTPGPKSVVRGAVRARLRRRRGGAGLPRRSDVAPDSMTETFVAAKLYVDNWRWADTPFYVRMGKRLARRETTIAIQFKSAPHPPFEEAATEGLQPNVLVVHVQPDEGVSLAIGAKVPGAGMTIRNVHMDFLYGGAFRTGPARGVRAADPRRDARRPDALHAHRRGRGAVVARRRDRRRVAARPAGVPELRGRDVGPGERRTS